MDFSLTHESSIAPVWFCLPLLPLNFCVLSYLRDITKPLGKFLVADVPTITHVRTTFARMCIELDRLKEKDIIWIGSLVDEKFWQWIEYERYPKFCKIRLFTRS